MASTTTKSDPGTDPSEEESKTARRFLDILSQAKGFITYFFSAVPLALIINVQFQGEVILIVLLTLILWVMVNEFALFIFEGGWSHRNHSQWYRTVQMLGVFVTQLGLYLFFQLIFNNITLLWSQGIIDVGETVVIIIAIIIAVFALIVIFYDIYSYQEKK
jgi:hypothetical protein